MQIKHKNYKIFTKYGIIIMYNFVGLLCVIDSMKFNYLQIYVLVVKILIYIEGVN